MRRRTNSGYQYEHSATAYYTQDYKIDGTRKSLEL